MDADVYCPIIIQTLMMDGGRVVWFGLVVTENEDWSV